MPPRFILSKDDIIAIHDKLALAASGFNSETNLDFIQDMVKDFPENAGIFPSNEDEKVVYLATYFLFHLVKGHCFNDGNKRTAFVVFQYQLKNSGVETKYDEKRIDQQLTIINQNMDAGEKPLDAINKVFNYDFSSDEYKLIWLIFELAGGNENINYNSPLEVYPIVHGLIRWKLQNMLEDRTMTIEKRLLPKTRFLLIPARREDVDRIVDEIIKQNPKTLALLARS